MIHHHTAMPRRQTKIFFLILEANSALMLSMAAVKISRS